MRKRLLSVGLDVGTTTTQLVVSELTVENRASGFAVPELDITERKIRYCSDVYTTPLSGHDRVDGAAIREILEREYSKAGIRPEDVEYINAHGTSTHHNDLFETMAIKNVFGEYEYFKIVGIIDTDYEQYQNLISKNETFAFFDEEYNNFTILKNRLYAKIFASSKFIEDNSSLVGQA